MPELPAPGQAPHDDPALFRAALAHTEGETGFIARLIEKDYFCSLALGFIYSMSGTSLVFKGGTCISKVYADFYRLSEDLDFTIPIADDAKRAERRAAIEPLTILTYDPESNTRAALGQSIRGPQPIHPILSPYRIRLSGHRPARARQDRN